MLRAEFNHMWIEFITGGLCQDTTYLVMVVIVKVSLNIGAIP